MLYDLSSLVKRENSFVWGLKANPQLKRCDKLNFFIVVIASDFRNLL